MAFSKKDIHFDVRLQHPFTCIVCGATQSGKTYFVQRLLERNRDTIYPQPSRIVWCYGAYQRSYEIMSKTVLPKIEFIDGLPAELYEQFNPLENNLLVIDDLMSESKNDARVTNLFTKGSHHRNLSIIYLLQNIFPRGKESRTISLNAHYMILFKNPRDPSQISYLGQQLYPENPKCLREAYADATKKPHSYIMIDTKQNTPDELRLRTGLLPGEIRHVYLPKRKLR